MMCISQTSRYLSQVNIEIDKARLLQHSEPVRLEITRERGEFAIDSDTIKLDIDNRAFFDSMGRKCISTLADDLISRGKQAVLEGEARYAKEADIMATPKNKGAISQIAVMRTQKSIETMLGFIPESPPQLNWTGGTVNIEYTPDRLNFNWDIKDIETTYIPYSINYSVQE